MLPTLKPPLKPMAFRLLPNLLPHHPIKQNPHLPISHHKSIPPHLPKQPRMFPLPPHPLPRALQKPHPQPPRSHQRHAHTFRPLAPYPPHLLTPLRQHQQMWRQFRFRVERTDARARDVEEYRTAP
jgi:hypothetical protein